MIKIKTFLQKRFHPTAHCIVHALNCRKRTSSSKDFRLLISATERNTTEDWESILKTFELKHPSLLQTFGFSAFSPNDSYLPLTFGKKCNFLRLKNPNKCKKKYLISNYDDLMASIWEKTFQFWWEIWIQVVVIKLQLYSMGQYFIPQLK